MAGCGRVAVNVLVLGAAGMLGPHVVRALEGEHNLRLTDIGEAPETDHEYLQVDAGDLGQVVAAAEGMDAIVNLSVLRQDPQLAFDVSARGCYNMMRAAVEHGIDRVINTGPHFTITGPSYELFDHGITGDAPSQSGTGLYALTKSLGQEICRVFTEHHDISVVTLLFYNFREADDHDGAGQDFTPYSVSFQDAGNAFSAALATDPATLPSKCEVFLILADLPHGKFSNEKAKRMLGWQPAHNLEQFWKKSPP